MPYRMLDDAEPSITYIGSGWSQKQGIKNATALFNGPPFLVQQGSKFLYKFTGVSISWYAHIPPGDGFVATANYSIDGGDPVSFSWLQFPNSDLRNQALFTSPTFPSGEHDLEVVFLGSSDTAPLTLDYLIVNSTDVAPTQTTATQAGSTRAGSTQVGSTQTGPAETRSTPQPNGHTFNVGAVIGGLLGALALLAGIVGLILFRRHWIPALQYRHKAALVRRRANQGLLVEPFNRQHAIRGLRDNNGGVHALRRIKSSSRAERNLSNGRSLDRAVGHDSTGIPSRQEDSGIRFPMIGDLPPNYTKH